MFKSDYIKALGDYKKAWRSASVQELVSQLAGNSKNNELFPYVATRK